MEPGNTDINELLLKHFEGETTPAEEAAIDAWKAANAEEYAVLKKAWSATASTPEPLQFDTEKAWNYVYATAVKKEKVFFLFSSYAQVYRMAAGLFLVIGFFIFLKFFTGSDPGTQMLVFQNPNTTVKEVTLPDGSQVFLKHLAQLSYETGNGKQRKMSLSGEAFFEVKRDTLHPFIIAASHGTVTVLGTSFNVDARDSISTVSVRSGLVRFTATDTSVLLKAGEMASAGNSGLAKVKETEPNYLSWKTGEFIFEDAPLEEIIGALNEYYGDRFEVAPGTKCRITAHFKNTSVDELGQMIRLICGGEVVHKGDKIVFQ
jgi:ferric-dicitrate binding protein FerR (iron transport regulator)